MHGIIGAINRSFLENLPKINTGEPNTSLCAPSIQDKSVYNLIWILCNGMICNVERTVYSKVSSNVHAR